MWILLADTDTKQPWIFCEDHSDHGDGTVVLFKDLDDACEMRQELADKGISSSFKAIELGI